MRLWCLFAAVAGLAACGDPPASPAAVGPPLQGVELTVGVEPAVTLSLAGAWVEEDGDGRGVQARAEAAGVPPLVVVGERTSWELREGVVVFEGGVRAERGEVVLSCDRLELRHSDTRVESADAIGSVRVARGSRIATGSRARLTTAEGRVELTGAPRLEESGRQLSGERITLFLDDERLECEACRLVVEGAAVAPVVP